MNLLVILVMAFLISISVDGMAQPATKYHPVPQEDIFRKVEHANQRRFSAGSPSGHIDYVLERVDNMAQACERVGFAVDSKDFKTRVTKRIKEYVPENLVEAFYVQYLQEYKQQKREKKDQ